MAYKSYKKDVVKAVNKAIHESLFLTGVDLVSQASRNITANGNIDTGRLRASTSAVVENEVITNEEHNGDINPKDIPRGSAGKGVLQYGTNVHYGPSIEKDYPYLKPAFKFNQSKYIKWIQKKFQEVLK